MSTLTIWGYTGTMNITYDSALKADMIKSLGGLRGVNCYFCGTPLNKDKHAGAIKLDGKLRHFCNSLPCLLEMNDRTKPENDLINGTTIKLKATPQAAH